MRRIFATALLALGIAGGAHAGDNQFKALEKGQGMVLIRLAEPHMTRAEFEKMVLDAPDIDPKYRNDPAKRKKLIDGRLCRDSLDEVTIHGGSFDPATGKSTRNAFTGRLDFTLVPDEATQACWLVGQVNTGAVALYALAIQMHWAVHYRHSVTFEVKPDSYNFIGTIDRRVGAQTIAKAVDAHEMPRETKGYEHITGDLEGFTPNSDVDGGQAAAADFLSRAWGHPVQVDAPPVTPADVTR